MGTMSIQKALDDIEQLSFEERRVLMGILKKREIDQRRDEILKNGKETLESIINGKAESGSVQDLKRYLLNED
jgi:hypothetical protein